jgi:hypothetical protein
MGFTIDFNPAAFDHGVSEADIFITDYHVNVFHAMPCRGIYHHLLIS